MQRSWTEDQDSELLSPQVPYPFSDMRCGSWPHAAWARTDRVCCTLCSIECTFIVIDPSRACGSDAARNEDRTAGEVCPSCMIRASYLVFLQSYHNLFRLTAGSLVSLIHCQGWREM